jgi:hypothetical protein
MGTGTRCTYRITLIRTKSKHIFFYLKSLLLGEKVTMAEHVGFGTITDRGLVKLGGAGLSSACFFTKLFV